MAIEQSSYGVVPVDRSAALLTELQAVCQRILAGDGGRTPGETSSLAPTLIATANGSAVASSLEALRRQCADNNQQVAALKRSVDGLRGVIAGDSAANGKIMVELGRQILTMTEVLDTEKQQMADLVRSVEALRVGLAGFSANNRQQVSELRGSLVAVEQSVTSLDARLDTAAAALGRQVETALGGLGQQISTALGTMAGQMQEAFNAFGLQVGEQMAEQGRQFEALLDELHSQAPRERLNALESLLTEGLPKFSEEIQAGVQQTLVAVSRTFRLAEREHGNRMAELHRDFDATARRLEAAIQLRRREETVGT